ncbi:hypothetical protein IQ07DRAFT_288910 [Pyrenochaeta sp. DS3sAY3a]|nr:hypothetical protein IQ07DRAFT_288910 [Pyrenochaeta sp. DS3sAY3a]
MRLTLLILATASAAQALNDLEHDAIYNFPMIPVLPVPGFNSTPNGFSNLGILYTSASKQLASYSLSLDRTNNLFAGTNGVNTDFKANLTTSLTGLLNILWQTAYEGERRVCAITTSINQQNVDSATATLVAAINAQVQAVQAITRTITALVLTIKTQALWFTSSEKAVIQALLQAIIAAGLAGVEPLLKLNSGLAAAGYLALASIIAALKLAVTTLQTAATFKWDFS